MVRKKATAKKLTLPPHLIIRVLLKEIWVD